MATIAAAESVAHLFDMATEMGRVCAHDWLLDRGDEADAECVRMVMAWGWVPRSEPLDGRSGWHLWYGETGPNLKENPNLDVLHCRLPNTLHGFLDDNDHYLTAYYPTQADAYAALLDAFRSARASGWECPQPPGEGRE